MPVPRLSIVVCTLNRAALLRDCLGATVLQLADDGAVEIIVVDNGSTDETPAVVRAHPEVRYVREPEPGLSRARNTGLAVARGEVVAFIDDDARPEARWASALLCAHDRWPSAVVLGGPVHLQWGAARPRWLVPELDPWFSSIDNGPDARLLGPAERVVGTNLAVVRECALAAGGFATELGRVGTSLASSEEMHLVRRMHTSGPVGWEPTAGVRHVVPAGRMTRRWLLRRAWAQGRSDAVEARLNGRTTRDLTSSRRALTRGWRYAARTISASPVPAGAVMRELVRRTRSIAQTL